MIWSTGDNQASPVAARHGFTLVEMLVVLGIIGLILASSVPAMTEYAKKARLEGATRQIAGLVSLARAMAISAHAQRTVLIDFDERELSIEETLDRDEPRRVRLPAAVEIEVESQESEQQSGPYRLVFQPSGSLAGRSATLLVSTNNRTRTIQILAATGAMLID